MRTVSLAWRLTALAGAVLVAVAASGPAAVAAVAAGSSGWRIVATIGSAASRVGDGDIVVTGASDAWAAWTCGPCPDKAQHHANLMQHWNGKHWSQVRLPGVLGYPAEIAGLGASSAQNLWAFTNHGQAAVFDGSHWTTRKLPDWVERPITGDEASLATAVLSPSDVWAFSIDAASQPTLAGHYTGGSWHKVSLPIIPGTADAVAPDDIWLSGFTKGFGERLLAHWNGKTWQTVSFPHAASGTTVVPSGLVALGAKSVWSDAEVFAKTGKVSFELLHWTGRWSATKVPASVGVINPFASDGGSGFWLITTTETGGSAASHFVHYTSGHWDTFSIPDQGKLRSDPGTFAPVPHSRSMWAIGFLVSGSVPEYGEIMGYGQ